MPNSVFPQQKPSMSLEQAIQQTIAHCQAGQWPQAETLYRAIVLTQPSPMQGQYWLSYIDALIKAGKPRAAVPEPGAAPAAASAQQLEPAPPAQPEQEARGKQLALEIPARIRFAKPANPCYTARRPGWPWKMALGCHHVPSRADIHLLLARYQRAQYDDAETLARSLTHAFPRHDLGWKVLVAALRMQGRSAEAQETQQQRRSSRADRRKNVQPA